MPQTALYTFGILDASAPAAKMQDFRRRAALVYADAARAPGYLGHAEKRAADLGAPMALGYDFGPWGLYAIPSRLAGLEDLRVERVIATLSVWRDVECARQFVYQGSHRAALASRRDWFLKGQWPGHVLWRIEDDVQPQWSEGVARLEALAISGESAGRFTFGSPYP